MAEVVAIAALAILLRAGLDDAFTRGFERARLPSLVKEGMPMLAGAVAFETLRPGGATGADQAVILATLGPTPLAVYRITSIVCQGLYYPFNALSTVMYPRFQQRYGQAQTTASLQRFVELQLRVLADVLLAGIAVLIVALPPAIAAFLPKYTGTIPPLRIMLVATYFVALAGPGAQLLLTIHKQVAALAIALPATALAFAAGWVGSRFGLEGVAAGVAGACVVEFLALNAYALSHLVGAAAIVRALSGDRPHCGRMARSDSGHRAVRAARSGAAGIDWWLAAGRRVGAVAAARRARRRTDPRAAAAGFG